MAITVTNRLLDATDTPGTGFSTASVAFQNGRLYLLAVYMRTATGTISSVSGGGLTWVQVASQVAGANGVLYVFRGRKTSGASTGALSIVCASATAAHYCLDELDGMDTTGTDGAGAIVQSNSGSANNAAPTAALAAFADAVQNVAYAALGCAQQNGATAEAGYAIVQTNVTTTPTTEVAREWKAGQDLNPSFSLAAGGLWAEIVVEIKAAGPVIGSASATSASSASATGRIGVRASAGGTSATSASGAGQATRHQFLGAASATSASSASATGVASRHLVVGSASSSSASGASGAGQSSRHLVVGAASATSSSSASAAGHGAAGVVVGAASASSATSASAAGRAGVYGAASSTSASSAVAVGTASTHLVVGDGFGASATSATADGFVPVAPPTVWPAPGSSGRLVPDGSAGRLVPDSPSGRLVADVAGAGRLVADSDETGALVGDATASGGMVGRVVSDGSFRATRVDGDRLTGGA